MIGYEMEFRGIQEQIRRLEHYDENAHKCLWYAMSQSVTLIESETRRPPPMGAPVGVSGRLRNSMASNVVGGTGSQILGKVGSTLRGESYPATMEFGRKPGRMPPPKALERWVHLVLGVSTEDAPGVAFQVARKIGRRGIKGKRFLRRAYIRSKRRVIGYFSRALELIARDTAGK